MFQLESEFKCPGSDDVHETCIVGVRPGAAPGAQHSAHSRQHNKHARPLSIQRADHRMPGTCACQPTRTDEADQLARNNNHAQRAHACPLARMHGLPHRVRRGRCVHAALRPVALRIVGVVVVDALHPPVGLPPPASEADGQAGGARGAQAVGGPVGAVASGWAAGQVWEGDTRKAGAGRAASAVAQYLPCVKHLLVVSPSSNGQPVMREGTHGQGKGGGMLGGMVHRAPCTWRSPPQPPQPPRTPPPHPSQLACVRS